MALTADHSARMAKLFIASDRSKYLLGIEKQISLEKSDKWPGQQFPCSGMTQRPGEKISLNTSAVFAMCDSDQWYFLIYSQAYHSIQKVFFKKIPS